MTRVEYDIEMSYNDKGDFDWDTFFSIYATVQNTGT